MTDFSGVYESHEYQLYLGYSHILIFSFFQDSLHCNLP